MIGCQDTTTFTSRSHLSSLLSSYPVVEPPVETRHIVLRCDDMHILRCRKDMIKQERVDWRVPCGTASHARAKTRCGTDENGCRTFKSSTRKRQEITDEKPSLKGWRKNSQQNSGYAPTRRQISTTAPRHRKSVPVLTTILKGIPSLRC